MERLGGGKFSIYKYLAYHWEPVSDVSHVVPKLAIECSRKYAECIYHAK